MIRLDADVRQWWYFPIVIPLDRDGHGPATIGIDAMSVVYQVWDCEFTEHGSFDNMPDAINEAIRLNLIQNDNA